MGTWCPAAGNVISLGWRFSKKPQHCWHIIRSPATARQRLHHHNYIVITDTGLTCRAPHALTTVAAHQGRAADAGGTDHAKPVSEAADSPTESSPGAKEANELSCVS